ncbi:MAG: septum formation protein Maf [Synechococcaceae bacterium WB8_1B_136]|nr:septum formation protein Maf [Synechococcaceae bacterium WB8_1B_136]
MLLLASASPARRRLLEQAAIPHRVRVSGVDEGAIDHPDPLQLVQQLARAKAEAVRGLLDPVADGEIQALLGCDSLLVFEGEVFGKPADGAEAIARHCLLPAVAAGAAPQGERLATVTTRVLFAPLTPGEIEAYVATSEPMQCAGGFALEGIGGLTVERIEGCFSNVIGLSLPLLRRWLAPLA